LFQSSTKNKKRPKKGRFFVVVVMGGFDSNRLGPILTPAGRLRFAAASKMLAHFVNLLRSCISTYTPNKEGQPFGLPFFVWW